MNRTSLPQDQALLFEYACDDRMGSAQFRVLETRRVYARTMHGGSYTVYSGP